MKLSKIPSALLVIATLSVSSIPPAQSQAAKAQDCSGSGSYQVDANGKCIDLSGLQMNSVSAESSANTAKTYIVKFKEGLLTGVQVSALSDQIAQQFNGQVGNVFQEVIQGMSIQLPASALQVLQRNPLVESIEDDQVVSLISPVLQTSTVEMTATAQKTPWGITRVGGFGNGTGKTAWILDTGIDLTHPDLRVDQNRCFTAFKPGTVEGALGCNDGNGHGTHVAGTIAALNNRIGVVGVAAGATVVPVKVLNSKGNGSLSGILAGIEHVATRAKAGDVANMSLGTNWPSPSLDRAVKAAAAKGIKFVLAAGNSSISANFTSPARVNGANIYTISAFGKGDKFAYFSNYGNPPIDYAAPGVDVLSTWKGGGYKIESGTSMAAPHAAGVLLLGAPKSTTTVKGDPDRVPDQIISR
jgi:subtilisin family serine protease